MSNFKTFLFGMGAAYGIYYLTRKGPDGKSILDELLEHPADFMDKARKYALVDVVETIKQHIE